LPLPGGRDADFPLRGYAEHCRHPARVVRVLRRRVGSDDAARRRAGAAVRMPNARAPAPPGSSSQL
jgi:hypothetical protein